MIPASQDGSSARRPADIDLRREPRLRAAPPFSCSFTPMNVPAWWEGAVHGRGVVYNLSPNGLMLMSETVPPTGERLVLTIRLPHELSPILIDAATVCWRDTEAFGVEFTELSHVASLRLQAFLQRQLPCTSRPEDSSPQPSKRRGADFGRSGRACENHSVTGASSRGTAATSGQSFFRPDAVPLLRWGLACCALLVLYQAWAGRYERPPEVASVSPAMPPHRIPVQEDGPRVAMETVLGATNADRDGGTQAAPNSSFDGGGHGQRAQLVDGSEPHSDNPADRVDRARHQAPQEPSAKGPLPAGKAAQPSRRSDLSTSRMTSRSSASLSPGSPGPTSASLTSGSNRVMPGGGGPRSRPESSELSGFTVAFDGNEDRATWVHMRAILEYAREEIGRKFGYIPAQPIKVVLHTKQHFAEEMGTPAWADTLFDHDSGTIHIPVGRALDDLGWFSRVVRHVLVHALLSVRMNGREATVPTWLAEGLALQLAGDAWPDLEAIKPNPSQFVPLSALQGSWKQLSIDLLPLAYLEADTVSRALTARYGMYGVRQVLNVLGTGQSIEAAMQAKLSLSYERFERQWADDLNARLRPDLS